MILSSVNLASLLSESDGRDPLVIAPTPDLGALRTSGEAAVELRLGTWFLSPRRSAQAVLRLTSGDDAKNGEKSVSNSAFAETRYVPFGKEFVLHPRSFVLAATLEWIRMTTRHAGYVTGKSSWGRRGLVIETAPGVHPGFSGCLTLELANVGEIPIALVPGTRICQLFVHTLVTEVPESDAKSSFLGRRKPILGDIRVDAFLEKLSKRLNTKGRA